MYFANMALGYILSFSRMIESFIEKVIFGQSGRLSFRSILKSVFIFITLSISIVYIFEILRYFDNIFVSFIVYLIVYFILICLLFLSKLIINKYVEDA